MRWRRKVERDGVWWAQARDGSWARWDADANDWSPQFGGPPGGATPLEPLPEDVVLPPADESPAGSATWYFVKTWAEVAWPGLAVFGLALLALVPVTLLWNTIFSPWLTAPIHIGDVMLLLLGALVAGTGFLSLAWTVTRFLEPPLGIVVGAAVLLGGTALTFWGVSRISGVTVGALLASRETAMVAFIILAGWMILAVKRWVGRD